MVQLRLVETVPMGGLSDVIADCAHRWICRVGAGAYISAAAGATETRFSAWGERDLQPGERGRVQAYFAAVVTRRIIAGRDQGCRAAHRRLVVDSIAADLRAAGWAQDRAAQEALRTVGGAQEGGA